MFYRSMGCEVQQERLIFNQHAHFYGDEDVSEGLGAPQWIPLARTEDHASRLLAAYVIYSTKYSNQFVLLLLLYTPSSHPRRLRFSAFETTLGSFLKPLSAYESLRTWHEPNRHKLVPVGGQSIKGVSLNTTPRDLPGGRCFEVDIIVSTMGNSPYDQPENKSLSEPIEQATSGAKSRTLISKLRGRAGKEAT